VPTVLSVDDAEESHHDGGHGVAVLTRLRGWEGECALVIDQQVNRKGLHCRNVLDSRRYSGRSRGAVRVRTLAARRAGCAWESAMTWGWR
jgi:hypothetical protein